MTKVSYSNNEFLLELKGFSHTTWGENNDFIIHLIKKIIKYAHTYVCV